VSSIFPAPATNGIMASASWSHSSAIVPPPNPMAYQVCTYGDASPPIGELDGTWINTDSQWEEYVISGRRVTRNNARGTKEFTIQWDPYRCCWQWGTHGRLSLQWLDDHAIAWIPDFSGDPQHSRVWHWRRTHLPASSRGAWGQPRSSHRWSSREAEVQRSRRHSSDHHSRRNRSRSRDQRWHWGRASHQSQRGWRHGSSDVREPCGLTRREVGSLLYREIGPEDYDLLLRLDEAVPKQKPSTDAEFIDSLPTVQLEEFMGCDCSVCLSVFEKDSVVVLLPCKHKFHRDCIATWLSEYRSTCPLCCSQLK